MGGKVKLIITIIIIIIIITVLGSGVSSSSSSVSPGGCFLKLDQSPSLALPPLSRYSARRRRWLQCLLLLLPGCCLKAAAAASPSLPVHADDSQLASEWEALVFGQTHKWHQDEIN